MADELNLYPKPKDSDCFWLLTYEWSKDCTLCWEEVPVKYLWLARFKAWRDWHFKRFDNNKFDTLVSISLTIGWRKKYEGSTWH